MTLASVGLWAGFFGPIQVLLALQAAALTPSHKEATLGLVTGLGAAVSTLGNPLAGAFSDRTRSRFGRRLPWVVGGALTGVVAMVILAFASSVAMVIAGWCLAQAGLNAMLAALSAAVPDLVPERQRGLVSGWLGVAQTLGIVVGTGIAAAFGGIRGGYLALAALVVVTTVPYALRSLDVPMGLAVRAPVSVLDFLRGFWISPSRHPDFGWAWATRFLVNVSNALGTLYLLFYLSDAVGVAEPDQAVFVLTVLYAVGLVATTVAAGAWSDRIGQRRVFVVVSGAVMAAAAGILAVWPTWPGAITGALVLGAGFGVYASVDFALITQVLPTAGDHARDLGVINIANALPQVLAPALAAPIVRAFADRADGYRALYAVAAVVGLVGALLVRRIRSVR